MGSMNYYARCPLCGVDEDENFCIERKYHSQIGRGFWKWIVKCLNCGRERDAQ
jgi:hypothetical protein